MKQEYRNIFKDLVKSYYDNKFDEKIIELLSIRDFDKEDFANEIASLCGVEVKYDSNFISNLKNAITSYNVNYKIVHKVHDCSMDCIDINGKTLCQKSCPFDAIGINKEKHTTYIDTEKCTDCGFCIEGCPTGSILDKVEFIPLINLLKGEGPIIAAVAPAISGQFGDDVTINQLRSAFKKIGFTDMIEVAFFADMLTMKESVEFDHLVKKKDDLMITSCCCPMWVGMVKRVYNDLIKYVSPSVSPMMAAGRVLKKLNPDCKVVFIGPCIAKKAEAKEKDLLYTIDFVLTFSELKDIFEVLNINPSLLHEDISTEYASRGGRLYARTGGVSIAIGEALEELFPLKYKLLNAVQGNGVKECKELLLKAQSGTIDSNFIEGMGCVGGCVGGPKAIISKEIGTQRVNEFADSSQIKIATHSDCMLEILSKIGINSLDDFKDENKTQIFKREF